MSSFRRLVEQYAHSTIWCRHSKVASFLNTVSSHPPHLTATNAQSSRRCPPSRYLAQVVGQPNSEFGQNTTRSFTRLATMIGAAETSPGFSGLRSTGHDGEHSRDSAMQPAQKVCRHLVVTGSSSGEWQMGHCRLSSTLERYVRARRSRVDSDTDDGKDIAVGGHVPAG